jgi:hypothetical protein
MGCIPSGPGTTAGTTATPCSSSSRLWLVVAQLFCSLRTRAARWFTGVALIVGSIGLKAGGARVSTIPLELGYGERGPAA